MTASKLWYLREWLEHENVLQERVAEAIGKSPARVSEWAKHGHNAQLGNVAAIADFLGIPTWQLFVPPSAIRTATIVDFDQ